MIEIKSSTPKALLLALAGTAGIALGACQEEEQAEASPEIEMACADYCERSAECDDEVKADECTNECIAVLEACETLEPDEAIDQVEECGSESCDDFNRCTLSAGVQCVFGLGF